MKFDIFGPHMEEVAGRWRRPHNEELHSSYASPDIVMVIKSSRISGACRTHKEIRNAYKILFGKLLREEVTRKT
jgi:hypothetical protein